MGCGAGSVLPQAGPSHLPHRCSSPACAREAVSVFTEFLGRLRPGLGHDFPSARVPGAVPLVSTRALALQA